MILLVEALSKISQIPKKVLFYKRSSEIVILLK